MTDTDSQTTCMSSETSLHDPNVSPNSSGLDTLSSKRRNLIDEDVLTWVTATQSEGKVITPNLIRQKAYEIGRQYDPYFKASINWYNKWKKKYDYEESAEADALKHKKRSYTAAFKLYAVQRANELLSISQASLELNVSRRCLQRWKEEIDVISKVAEKASNAVYRRPGQGRKVADANLDTLLLEWLEEVWRNGDQVTSVLIRQKARELSANQDFKASLGWFVKWQKRHNIDLKEQTIDSPLRDKKPVDASPLRLRLLPEGQEITYSDRTSLSRKRKREFEGCMVQGDDEFDRLLLTWLVERWEAGIEVNEKMVRERAIELNTSQEFRPSKTWLLDWKTRYNVSLEDHTYGIGGECEGEIVEESQVYDEVTLQENPLTPTKEEAATALASLASEDPSHMTVGGIEIAQALQKLASAFGLTPDNNSKTTLAEQLHLNVTTSTSLSSVLTPTIPSSTNTTYLLENGEVQVGAEEVVSEEVVTDDPVVVLETTVEQDVNDISKRLMDNFTSSSSYHNEQIISTSSSLEFSVQSLAKVPTLDVPATNTTCNMDLDSNVNLLTTLADSTFNTETSDNNNNTCISNSTCNMGVDMSVDQLIKTSLSVINSQDCSEDDFSVSADIVNQMYTPTSNKVVLDQGGMVIDEVSGSDIIESEVVISEPMMVTAETGHSNGEQMTIIYNEDVPIDNEDVCHLAVVYEESTNDTNL